MTDFKAGDKVEVRTGIAAPWEGVQLTVTEANRKAKPFGGAFDLRVVRADGTEGLFDNHEVKLVKPEPKFKVGDWVKVHGRHDMWDGTVGTVQKAEPWLSTPDFLYLIHKDDKDGSVNALSFFERQLEATEAPKLSFKVGTFVTFAEPDNDHWQGGKAEVIEGKGWGRYTTRLRIIAGPPKNDLYRDNKGYELNFDPAHLKLWEAPKPSFQVGDRVAPTQTAVSEHKGEPGAVTKVKPESPWPFEVTYSSGDSEIFREDEIEFAPKFATGGWVLPAYAEADVRLTAKVFGNLSTAVATGYSKDKPEAVKHPAHYGGDTTYEAIKVIEAWGLGFNLGNAAKYLARAGKKGNKVEDLKKLVEYVQFEIAKEEAK